MPDITHHEGRANRLTAWRMKVSQRAADGSQNIAPFAGTSAFPASVLQKAAVPPTQGFESSGAPCQPRAERFGGAGKTRSLVAAATMTLRIAGRSQF
jgi:hypothetical protein